MDRIDIFGNSNEEFLNMLSQRKAASIENGIAHINRPGFKGDIYLYELKDCIHVRLTDFYTQESIRVNYHTNENMIGCYFLCGVDSKDQMLLMDEPINHDIICIKQNQIVTYQISGDSYLKLLYVGIPKSYFPSYYDGSSTTLGRLMNTQEFCMFQMETPAIKALCDKMLSVQNNSKRRYNLSLSVAFELLAHLFELIELRDDTIPTKALKEHHIATVIKARTVLLSNIRVAPVIDDIAVEVGSSSTQLRRNFKILFGESMYQYYKRYKLELCYNWLQEGGISVKEAAYKIGYRSNSKFSSEFKKQYGVLPKEMINT